MLNYTKPEYEADILEVIANLSNDAVFTPPKVANALLDLLPSEVWSDPNLRWLDPGSKTGIFPREVTKRLLVGLADVIPNEEARLEHILKRMVFAIATEEITAMMSRRSLYCSKFANSEHSVVKMPTISGNVWHERVEHSFVNGKCTECKGTKIQLEKKLRDNKAYPIIHTDGLSKLQKELDMKFDVIIGNPPYQMDADTEGQNITPIYNSFVEQATALNPKYIAMIIPSRWLAGGKWLDDFRDQMLKDKRIRTLVDFPNAEDVFPGGVGKNIKGGVQYFLWDRDYQGKCQVTTRRGENVIGPYERQLDEFDIFVRDARALPILHKVLAKEGVSFSELVSTRDPFGPALSSNFTAYRKGERKPGDYRLYLNQGTTRLEKWVDPSYVTKNLGLVPKWKVLVPIAGSDGGQKIPDSVLGQPMIAGPRSVCTLTYLVIGPLETKEEAVSVESYVRTKFVRFLISLRKISQHTTQKVFLWVPQQKWDKEWTDAALYKKYSITPEEQEYIASMVKEM